MKKYTYLELSGLSKVLVTFLIIGAAADAIAAYGDYLQYQLLSAIQTGEDYTQEQIDGNDLRQGAIGLLQLAVTLITAIIFLKWTYRIINNAYSIDGSSLTISPGWGIGYYFVPIFSLWKPYQALRDAYDVLISKCAVERNQLLFSLWWAAWLISCFAGQAVFRLSLRAETIDELIVANSITLGSDAWDFLLNLIAIMLVMHVTYACVECHESRNSRDQFSGDIYEDDDLFES